MKKFLYILIGFALAVGVLGVGGLVYAQTQDSPETPFPCPFCDGEGFFGHGGMKGGRFGGRGGFGSGMMSGSDGVYGPMHDAMSAVLAEAFGLSVEELDALHEEGTSLREYAESQGMTAEEFQTQMLDVREAAFAQAVEDGTLTQEQADWILDRMGNFGEDGFGGRGMRGGPGNFSGERSGALHEYMQPALAEAFGFSVEELEALHDDGSFNLKDYAAEQGWTDEEIQELMRTAMTNAINAALEDGAITQEQADWMLENLDNFGSRMPFGHGGRGGRHWNSGE